MTVETVGTVGAIVVTVLLFILRHFVLPSERSTKTDRVAPTGSREPHEFNGAPRSDAGRFPRAPESDDPLDPLATTS